MAVTQVRGQQVKDGDITDADIATANKDGVAATPSMRTLGTGSTQACAGNDARLSDARTPVGTSLSASQIWVGTGSNIAAAVNLSNDGTLATDGSLTIAAQVYQRGRNGLINADFNIWQRNTSFSFAAAASGYTADRWKIANGCAATISATRTSDRPALVAQGQSNYQYTPYCMTVGCTVADASVAAGDYGIFLQYIEGFNWQRFYQRQITLSFWVKSNLTGIFCVFLQNSGQDRSYVAEYTISNANTWEKKTVVISANPSAGTWDLLNGKGCAVGFCLMGGSTFQTTAGSWATGNFFCTSNQTNLLTSTSNSILFSQVQLEVGGTVTPFDQQSVWDSWVACQRYYEKSYDDGNNPGTNAVPGYNRYFHPVAITNGVAAQFNVSLRFKVTKRAIPTVTIYNYAGTAGHFSNAATDAGTAVSGNLNTHSISDVTGTPNANYAFPPDVVFHWTADSEL